MKSDDPLLDIEAWYSAVFNALDSALSSSDPPDVNKVITAARERAGLSKEKAAERAGVGPDLWRRWELGSAIPCHTSCKKISEALNYPFEILFMSAEFTRLRRKARN